MPKKVYNILTIICLASIILIPIGLALMWLSTEWKKRTKIMISSVLGLFYITLVVFILLLEPSNNTGELNLPLSYEQSYSEDGASLNESSSKELPSKNKSKKDSKRQTKKSKEQGRLPKSVSKQKGVPLGRLFYSILFFLFMLLLIINQNRKSGKKNSFENPYVDTNMYKLPLSPDSKMPIVHYLHLKLNSEEKLYYATPTNQKDNEGDFLITNQRVVIKNLHENVEFPIKILEAASSVSNSVICITSGSKKYYVFMDSSQVKYALAILRWSFSKAV